MNYKDHQPDSLHMEMRKNVGDRQRLARTAFAVLLTVAAVRSLQRGKRLRGLLAGVGALALGLEVSSGPGHVTEMIGATEEDVELRCAACGQPIRPGQARGPNENHEIVHEACKAEA